MFEDAPDDEIIVIKKINFAALFGGGGISSSSYKMWFVPLKLGVKINPENNYYTPKAVTTYKDRAQQLMAEKIRLEYDEMEEQEAKGNSRNPHRLT